MQYCVILDVDNVTDATAVGILLQRYGYKIVSAQVTPSNCPIQQEASNCEACPVVAKPAARDKVLVFGTFDRLNAGHVAFLERARQFGDELIVLVVEDEFVTKYKGKKPVWSLMMRMAAVRRLPFKARVYEEDIRENWESLKKIQPDVIVLSAEQAGWRHRLDLVLEEYCLPTRVEVLPEKQLETNAAEVGQASAARNP
jgi:cytidyltransferase-like protein